MVPHCNKNEDASAKPDTKQPAQALFEAKVGELVGDKITADFGIMTDLGIVPGVYSLQGQVADVDDFTVHMIK